MTSLLKAAFDLDDLIKAPFVNRHKGLGVSVELDVPYADGKYGTADIYIPPNSDTRYPVLINVHGGGWVTGDKRWRRSVGNLLAEAGIFVYTPNYRLAPKAKFPACLGDVFSSVNWLYDNAEKYSLDTDRFFISGDSAGGHIALSVAAYQDNADILGRLGLPRLKSKIKGVLPLCGVYDFTPFKGRVGSGGLIKNLTGKGRRKLDEYEFFNELSPVNYITETFPRAFILSAKHDLFTKPQPNILKTKLREVGVEYQDFEGHGLSGSDHCFYLRWQQKQSREVFLKIIEFILDY